MADQKTTLQRVLEQACDDVDSTPRRVGLKSTAGGAVRRSSRSRSSRASGTRGVESRCVGGLSMTHDRPARGRAADPDQGMSDVRTLLAAYDCVLLAAAGREHLVALVRSRPPRRGRLDVIWQLPRVTWFLDFFVTWHISRRVARLHAALSRRVAAGRGTARDAEDREAVTMFRDGLSAPRLRTYAVLLIIATFTIGRLALDQAGPLLSALPVIQNVQADRAYDAERTGSSSTFSERLEIREEARRLVDRVGDAIGTDVASLGALLDAFGGANVIDILLVIVGIAFALYIVLRPFTPAFRLKRMLMNLGGDPYTRARATARWQVQRSSGVYRRERAVFKRLGEAPPQELPLDLLVPMLLWLSLPMAVGVYLITGAPAVIGRADWTSLQFEYAFALGSGYIAIAVCRLGWLCRSAWRRRGPEPGPLPPYEVEIDGVRLTVRDPFSIGTVVYFVPYYAVVWWYLANRQIAAALHASSAPTRRWRYPILSPLAFTSWGTVAVIPTFVSILRGRRRLHEAERAADVDRPGLQRTLGVALAILASGYVLKQSPIVPAGPLVFSTRPYVPVLDPPFYYYAYFPPIGALLTGTAVIAVFAGYVQRRINSRAAARRRSRPGGRPAGAAQLLIGFGLAAIGGPGAAGCDA